MVCTDRQLNQTQREAGFLQSTAPRGIRPPPLVSDEALNRWLQHELHPAMTVAHGLVNKIHKAVLYQVPSGNPLSAYAFAFDAAPGDPGVGFLKLNAQPQNTASVIRISEQNIRRDSMLTWLQSMAGSGTVPLGTVTLQHAIHPERFLRFTLNSMTDQGAYWDLGVTLVEASDDNPFDQSNPEVVVAFVPGIASGGVTPATTIPYLRGLQAGTQTATSGTVIFSNSNGISFGMAGSATVTASFGVRLSAGTTNALATQFSFSNDQNVFFGMNGSTVTANASFLGFGLPSAIDGAAMSMVPISGLSWSISSFTYANAGKTKTGFAYTPTLAPFLTTESQLGLVSHVGGNSVASITRLAFSDASGVTWSLSTAASAATVIASANDQSLGMVSHVGGSTVRSVTRLALSNAGNFSWSLNSAANAVTLSGAVTAVALAAGTQQANTGTVVFENSNGVTFGMSGFTQVTASYAREMGLVSHVGGNVVSSVTRLAFSNASNVTWSLSTAANAATVLASVPNDLNLGVVSHVGGNAVSSVTRLAFSNASNVTFSLSTAANAATVLASVDAGGGGGALRDRFGNSATLGTITFTGQTNSTVTDLFSGATAFSNNVEFMVTNGSVKALAFIRVSDASGGTGNIATRINFLNSNGVTWGQQTAESAAGARELNITATVATNVSQVAGTMPYLKNWLEGRDIVGYAHGGALTTSGMVFPLNQGQPMPGNMTIETADLFMGGASATSTSNSGSFAWTIRGGLYSLANSTQLTRINSFSSSFSQNTNASSASTNRNNSFLGDRAIPILSSNWSSQPVLSAGVAYWMQLNISTAGIDYASVFRYHELYNVVAPGVWGSTNTAAFVSPIPFCGFITGASGPNASIGTAAFNATFSINNPIPVLQFRNGVAMV